MEKFNEKTQEIVIYLCVLCMLLLPMLNSLNKTFEIGLSFPPEETCAERDTATEAKVDFTLWFCQLQVYISDEIL